MSPGGYLLSRDLSSDYHRRADVSLPGSEWDRVGPSGYDHQVARSFAFLLLTVYPVGHCIAALLLSFCLLKQQTDIRVAMRRVYHNFFCVEVLSLESSSSPGVIHLGVYEVYRMLVVLG